MKAFLSSGHDTLYSNPGSPYSYNEPDKVD